MAEAFRLNNPGCTVFVDDCNELLRLAMNVCVRFKSLFCALVMNVRFRF